METLIVLIGIFLGGETPQIKILGTYAKPSTCYEIANRAAEKAPPNYIFACRPAKFTKS